MFYQQIKNHAFLVVLLFAGALSGCAGLNPYSQQPEVSVSDIQVVEIKTLETILLLELRITNPNERDLHVKGITCELEVDDSHFARGISGEQHIVPAYGSLTIPVTVYASMLDMASTVMKRIQRYNRGQDIDEPLRYTLAGSVRLGGSTFNKSLPFTAKGELSLR